MATRETNMVISCFMANFIEINSLRTHVICCTYTRFWKKNCLIYLILSNTKRMMCFHTYTETKTKHKTTCIFLGIHCMLTSALRQCTCLYTGYMIPCTIIRCCSLDYASIVTWRVLHVFSSISSLKNVHHCRKYLLLTGFIILSK